MEPGRATATAAQPVQAGSDAARYRMHSNYAARDIRSAWTSANGDCSAAFLHRRSVANLTYSIIIGARRPTAWSRRSAQIPVSSASSILCSPTKNLAHSHQGAIIVLHRADRRGRAQPGFCRLGRHARYHRDQDLWHCCRAADPDGGRRALEHAHDPDG